MGAYKVIILTVCYMFFLVSISYSAHDNCDMSIYCKKTISMLKSQDEEAFEKYSKKFLKECAGTLSNRDLAMVYSDVAVSYYRNKDYHNTIKYCKLSIDEDYLYIGSHIRLINSLLSLSQFSEAKNKFEILSSLYNQYYKRKIEDFYSNYFSANEKLFNELKKNFK